MKKTWTIFLAAIIGFSAIDIGVPWAFYHDPGCVRSFQLIAQHDAGSPTGIVMTGCELSEGPGSSYRALGIPVFYEKPENRISTYLYWPLLVVNVAWVLLASWGATWALTRPRAPRTIKSPVLKT